MLREYFREQRTLALRRLETARDTGRYDGSYLIGNSPIVLCEIKRFNELGEVVTRERLREILLYHLDRIEDSIRVQVNQVIQLVEILLTNTRHFEGVSVQFAGMAITTLEKCSDAESRRTNVMALVDTVADPRKFPAPPADRVSQVRQEDQEALPETPFFVGVPRELFEAARGSLRLRDVARGRQGLATADDARFLAAVDDPRVVRDGIATEVSEHERREGIPPGRSPWVPFAKGEGFGEYWRSTGVVIDWSMESVAELECRHRLPAGTSRRPRFQNREFYFRPGLTYSVIEARELHRHG